MQPTPRRQPEKRRSTPARRLGFPVLLWSSLLLWSSTAAPAQHSGNSEWWLEVNEIEELLQKQKWKLARRDARSAAKKLTGQSWHGPELGKVLAQLALARAIADANLDNDRDAIWYWHIASNLDYRVRKRDLHPYGKAAKLLYESPLRSQGKTPVGFENRERGPLIRSTPPRAPEIEAPTILNNTGAAQHGPADFHVEVLVDKQGSLHHPVVISTYNHPIIQYAVLEWIYKLPAFEPGTVEGEATDRLFPLVVAFHVKRW